MIRIFQIGNYRVNLVPSSKQGVLHSLPIQFKRPSDELTGVSGDVVYASPGRPLVQTGKWKVEGALLCGSSISCASADQQFKRLVANGGDIVPIIAVLPAECCPCERCGGYGCSDCTTKPEDMWLLTYGMVTDYKSDYKQDFNQAVGIGEINVSMDIEGPIHWEPLNDVEWKYWGKNKPIYPDITTTVAKHVHPYGPKWNRQSNDGFQYLIGDGTFMYSPANWILAYSRVRNRRARAILTNTDYTSPIVNITKDLPYVHSFEVPITNWPAQPKSLYYFSNLPQEGELSLSTEGFTLQGHYVTNTATLDLSDLNSNSEINGINPADSIIVGDIGGSFNGIYLLGGATLAPAVYIPWVKTGLYPGETVVGRNTITASISNSDYTIDYAYIHIFRSY